MNRTEPPTGPEGAPEFSRMAEARRSRFLGELWGFLKNNKKWWLGPILVVFLLVGILVVLGGSSAVSFIYTLF